jgi:hypothetical protein
LNLSSDLKLKLSSLSARRLSIAKELYIHGCSHSGRSSIVDVILSILNFDFAAETMVKAVLTDHDVAIARQKGGFKTYDELIGDLKQVCPSLKYVEEVISLHKLRNDTQHNGLIPSEQEVYRHKLSTRLFIDEVCQKVYGDSISYDNISLVLFIKSENEKVILQEMETVFASGKYSDAVYYGKQVAIYHILLLRECMGVPYRGYFSNPWTSSRLDDFRDIGRYLEELTEGQNWIIDRLCVREHYDEINKLLGGRITSNLHWRRREIERGHEGQTEAEDVRNLVYEFITSTQDIAREADLKSPFIFDLTLMKAESIENSHVKVGVVSSSPIVRANVIIRENPSKADVEKGTPLKDESLDAPLSSGLFLLPVRGLKKDGQYQLGFHVANEIGENDDVYMLRSIL